MGEQTENTAREVPNGANCALRAVVLTSYVRSGRIGSADRSEARIGFHLQQADV